MLTTAAAVAVAALLGYATDELRLRRERAKRRAGEIRTRRYDNASATTLYGRRSTDRIENGGG